MTPEMAFECLLVGPDPAVFTTMDGILHDLSIETKVCPCAANATKMLEERSADLIVIDLEAENSRDFLQYIGRHTRQKPTVLAVSTADCSTPDAHLIVRKPVTRESALRSLKVAYSRMVRDYRKHTRFAVMTTVTAIDDENRSVQITVTNIGEGGIGLTSIETLEIGSVLSFRL